MTSEYRHLFYSLRVGGLALKNRIFSSGHAEAMAEEPGTLTKAIWWPRRPQLRGVPSNCTDFFHVRRDRGDSLTPRLSGGAVSIST
jgi:2,4-dienoyl-CoA reductase-like NADH-dependent reductase (Old Yellow Enzyme family)